jgi:hypothetical protein
MPYWKLAVTQMPARMICTARGSQHGSSETQAASTPTHR